MNSLTFFEGETLFKFFLVLDKIVKLDLRLINDFLSEILAGRDIDTWRTLAPVLPISCLGHLRVRCDDSHLSVTESAFAG